MSRNFDPGLTSTLRKLLSTPYIKRRHILTNKTKPPYPRFIYKYRSLDPADTISVDRLRDLIVKFRFWLSSADDFNDPFDMSLKYTAEGTHQERRNRIKKLMRQQGESKKDISRKLPLYVKKNASDLADIFSFSFNVVRDNCGVYSFAGDPRNILMWSHYADHHKGVCLQFEIAQDFETFARSFPIEYKEEYPRLNIIREPSQNAINGFLRKYPGWAYENERRILFIGMANKYMYFRAEALTGIIFGCRASEQVYDEIDKLLEERARTGLPDVRQYRAQKHEEEYKLVIKDR